jgi:hypothetical protein
MSGVCANCQIEKMILRIKATKNCNLENAATFLLRPDH